MRPAGACSVRPSNAVAKSHPAASMPVCVKRSNVRFPSCGHAAALALGSYGRVEDGRGRLGHAATLRFPSPLIEPDVPISGIRLSDWLHREAHGEKLWPQASSVQQLSLLRLTIQLSLQGPDHSRCLQAYRQSPSPRHLRAMFKSDVLNDGRM